MTGGRKAAEALWTERAGRDGVRQALEAVALFDDYDGRELETLASFFRAYAADAGTEVFSEGDPSDFLCLLVSGAAEVVKADQHGVEHVLATVRSGRTLGEMALIDEEPRSASARLSEPAEFLVLGRASFHRLSAEHPRLALQFILAVSRLLSRRLRQTSGMLVDHLG